MAEEAAAVETPVEEEPKKKKKGKLPLIVIVVVALVLGGGFFKLKSGGSTTKPEVKLGTTEKLDEFLVNLRGGNSYMRTEIGLQFKEGFTKEELEKNLGAVRDAINMTLSGKRLIEVNSVQGKAALKRQLAAAINRSLESNTPTDSKQKKVDHIKPIGKPQLRKHPDWDSDEGPVLKVYFFTIATQ